MIDQNRDGFIDNDDLKDMLASLGKVRAANNDVKVDTVRPDLLLVRSLYDMTRFKGGRVTMIKIKFN